MQRPEGAPCAVSKSFADLHDETDVQHTLEFRCRFKREPWSIDEDAVLREMASASVASREIALKLSRTLAAVRHRARVIGVQLAHASQVGACRRYRRRSERPEQSTPKLSPHHSNSHFYIDAGIHS